MTSPESAPTPEAAFSESRFGSLAVVRLRAVFERTRHPMLISDDQRRWVMGNAAAADLLGIAREEIPWRKMDEFTPSSQLARLEDQWKRFLISGEAEGQYYLHTADRGVVAVEFSATAHLLPGRHLAVFVAPEEEAATDEADRALVDELGWAPVAALAAPRSALTAREREVMTFVASGLQSAGIAEQLVLSAETVKSHVQHAMDKLGARTRAHAVAIALVTGEIPWKREGPGSAD